MIERFFSYNNGARFIAYDGTGETVQLTWAKQLDLWKITGMKYTINGHGHLGAPATEATLDEVTAYIDGILAARNRHPLLHQSPEVAAGLHRMQGEL